MDNCDVLFYLNPQPMWVYAADTLLILEVNAAAIKRYGFNRDEFIGKNIRDLRPPEDIAMLENSLKNALPPVSVYREFRHMASDGSVFNVEIVSYKYIYQGINARLVQAQDINAKKAIQGKLQLTQAKLDKLLDSTSIGFYQLDNNLNVTYWNNSSEKMMGYSREYIIGKNIWDVFPEAIQSDFHTFLNKAITERVNVEFTEYYWPLQKWFFTNMYPGDDGTLVHFRDVTHIKRSQEVLLEKIEQLKEVSFFNSHYIRKPVASLLGLTHLVNESIVQPDEFKEIAAQIQVCSLELDQVIKKINKKVSDGDNLTGIAFEMEEFSVSELVDNVITSYIGNTFGHRLILQAEKDIHYYGNKHGIRMALESVIDNAIKFSPEATDIIIILDTINQNVVLSVQDFGIGMDDWLINRIFLGFAKKALARELGEGLAKVAEMVRRHHGNIWVESKPNKGSTFSIRLPLSNISAFKAGIKPDATAYRDMGLEITYNKEIQYIRLDWRGFQSLHTIKAGCYELVDVLQKYKCHMALNINTNVIGSWEDAAEWVGKDCFPMLERAGLQFVAWVYSPSTFSRLSADLAIETMNGNVVIRTFEDEDLAKDWLEQMGSTFETINANYKPE